MAEEENQIQINSFSIFDDDSDDSNECNSPQESTNNDVNVLLKNHFNFEDCLESPLKDIEPVSTNVSQNKIPKENTNNTCKTTNSVSKTSDLQSKHVGDNDQDKAKKTENTNVTKNDENVVSKNHNTNVTNNERTGVSGTKIINITNITNIDQNAENQSIDLPRSRDKEIVERSVYPEDVPVEEISTLNGLQNEEDVEEERSVATSSEVQMGTDNGDKKRLKNITERRECPKNFSGKGKLHNCNFCGASFVREDEWNKHLKTHQTKVLNKSSLSTN
uniref:Transcriptional regulator CRZ1-like n=1 Tax=Diabrotica virgifera virgifera TaxID=50390 RepID=A0A6P7GBQ2_DIAVI